MKCGRILCGILAILILLMSCNGIVFAANNLNDFSKEKLEQSTVCDLQDLAQRASNDTEATAVYNELLDRVEKSQLQSSVVIDTYLTYYSTITNGTSIEIHYGIKALVPTGATLSLGYEYPASTRTYGSSIYVGGKSVGTYHAYFTSKCLRCASRTYASFVARNYSEKAVYRTFYAFDTSTRYTYHTVTSSEAAIDKIVLIAAGLSTTLIFSAGKVGKWIATIVAGLDIASTLSSFPGISTGQYIEVRTHFIANKIYQRVSIWHNYLAYQQGPDNPLYRSASSAVLPGF